MGSGGVLVEAMLNGNESIGVDLNPLAVLIARVKTTPIDPNILVKWSDKLLHRLPEQLRKKEVEIPKIRNLRFWFKPKAVKELAAIKSSIEDLNAPQEVSDFLRVCMSLAVRKASNVRNGEYKLYRKQGEELETFRPDAVGAFRESLRTNIRKMQAFYEAMKKFDRPPKTHPLNGDSKQLLSIDPNVLREGAVSLVVTSPPYGDAHTTVAYGQFSRYSALWLGFPEDVVLAVDDLGLGGTVMANEAHLGSKTLEHVLEQVRDRDNFRGKELYAFFSDLDKCLAQITEVLKKGKSHLCFVTGNRTVKRVMIPTDQILVELAAKHGFLHVDTKYREIPTKTIPWVNAPENISGMTSPTMSKESIIIWEY